MVVHETQEGLGTRILITELMPFFRKKTRPPNRATPAPVQKNNVKGGGGPISHNKPVVVISCSDSHPRSRPWSADFWRISETVPKLQAHITARKVPRHWCLDDSNSLSIPTIRSMCTFLSELTYDSEPSKPPLQSKWNLFAAACNRHEPPLE